MDELSTEIQIATSFRGHRTDGSIVQILATTDLKTERERQQQRRIGRDSNWEQDRVCQQLIERDRRVIEKDRRVTDHRTSSFLSGFLNERIVDGKS